MIIQSTLIIAISLWCLKMPAWVESKTLQGGATHRVVLEDNMEACKTDLLKCIEDRASDEGRLIACIQKHMERRRFPDGKAK